jgi:hypothetical protein
MVSESAYPGHCAVPVSIALTVLWYCLGLILGTASAQGKLAQCAPTASGSSLY